MAIGRYLAGIGALIWNEENNTYLVLKRSGKKDFAAGAWECVTGRVDQGEGFEEALYRETREELNVSVSPFLIIGTTHFYRGEKYPENELIGVIYWCTIDAPDSIQISPEHETYRWVTVEQARKLLSQNHPSEGWLLGLIERADRLAKLLPTNVREDFRSSGFELD